MRNTLFYLSGVAALASAQLPSGIEVLRGSTLDEPWMNPAEWISMGGETCDDCSSCAASEWSLGKKLGQNATDAVFLEHWKTWFTNDDATRIVSLGLNHVRIPIGFWIIEEIVDRSTEYFARGGWMQLKRGLKQLKEAGLFSIIDMHALPGVSSPNQMFSGNCTGTAHFYEDANYVRALTAHAVIVAMIHLDPDFEKTFALESINEPIQDANLTPGLAEYYADFVTVVRTVEGALGVSCSASISGLPTDISANAATALASALPLIPIYAAKAGLDAAPLQAVLKRASAALTGASVIAEVQIALATSGASFDATIRTHGLKPRHHNSLRGHKTRTLSLPGYPTCISVSSTPSTWQYMGPSASMAPAVVGPALYDEHVYYAYGGVSDPNYEAYMRTACNSVNPTTEIERNEVSIFTGEWSLATNWGSSEPSETLDAQLRSWGDAQKWKYSHLNSSRVGWTFWNFKNEGTGWPTGAVRQWSYFGAVDAGLLPEKADQYFNASVCAGFIY